MKKLTEREQVFVMAVMNQGLKKNYTKAARLAGYEGTENYLKFLAFKLAHSTSISAAIVEQTRSQARVATSAAMAYLEGTLKNPRIKAADKIKAATAILDRGGLHALSEVKRDEAEVAKDKADTLTKIVRLAKLLGIDPKALAGRMEVDAEQMKVIDGTAEKKEG